MTSNVVQLRPDPFVSKWGERKGFDNGLYYAEADLAGQSLGLWVERVRRGWRFQVIEMSTDRPVIEGRVRLFREAKTVLRATATRLMDPRRLV